MVQREFFIQDNNSWVEYYFKDDFLNIDCQINKAKCDAGACLYVCDNVGESLSLGTLSVNNGVSSISKSYPVSYLRFQGIDAENIRGFVLKKDNKTLLSTFEPTEEYSVTSADENDDPAVMRAKNLLSALGGKDFSEESREWISYVTEKLKLYSVKNISEISGFKWHIIDDIRETFGLSCVEHLVFCESFVRVFAKMGEWYFGSAKEPGMYALCIETDKESVNPFSNASDCSRMITTKNGKCYWIAGIGLFSDGQYFCRI